MCLLMSCCYPPQFLAMDCNLSHRHLDICTYADIRWVRCWTDENESIVKCHRHPLSPAFGNTDVFPLRLVRQAYLDDVAKQGNLRMTTMIDHPFNAELLVVASDKCFAQFTQETSMAGTAVPESESQGSGRIAVHRRR